MQHAGQARKPPESLADERAASADARSTSAEKVERGPGEAGPRATAERRQGETVGAEPAGSTVSASSEWSEELTHAEIIERAGSLFSHTLIDVLYAIARDQLGAEERRQSLLVTKANALLGVLGLTASVVFTYGLYMVKEGMTAAAVVGDIVALVFALGTVFCATMSMRVRDSAGVGSSAVFLDEALARADLADMPPDADGKRSSTSTGKGTAAYKRYLIPYVWRVFAKNSSRHDTAATWVSIGQWLYVGFLAAIFVTGIFVANAAKTGETAQTPPRSGAAAYSDWCSGP